MLKPQDILLLLKLLAHLEHLNWPQHKLALHLCVSVSVVNAGLKRLSQSGLLRLTSEGLLYQPVMAASEELLLYGVKYIYPAQLGGYTRGIVTSYAAPIFKKHIAFGQDPVPVWPYAKGDQQGLALEPLYPSVPQSITEYPDAVFYDLLTLIDAIRQGRSRERSIATKLLKEKLHAPKKK